MEREERDKRMGRREDGEQRKGQGGILRGCRIRIDRQTEGKAKKHNTMKERKKGKVGGK